MRVRLSAVVTLAYAAACSSSPIELDRAEVSISSFRCMTTVCPPPARTSIGQMVTIVSTERTTGVIAGKLTSRFAHVTGIDGDDGMAAAASARLAGEPRVSIMRCRLVEFAESAGEDEADLITMLAVLHHLDLGGTLARAPASWHTGADCSSSALPRRTRWRM